MTLQEELSQAYEQVKSTEQALRKFTEDASAYEVRQLGRAQEGLPLETEPTELQKKILQDRHSKAMQKARQIQEQIWANNREQHEKKLYEVRVKISALLPAILELCDEERRLCGAMDCPASHSLHEAIQRSKLLPERLRERLIPRSYRGWV